MPAITELDNSQSLFDKLMKIKKDSGLCYQSLIEKSTELVDKINTIQELKAEKNAVILAHTYVIPEIIYGVSDFVGDSYALSKDAVNTPAQTIVFASVRFMGETAKILNPHKDVLMPATDGGCTLADAINAEQVRKLRAQYPDYTFVCYINTTAEVKAECDVCVTSANVFKVVENLPNDKIYFLPDRMMGQNLIEEMKRRGIKKDIKYFSGTCYVHEEYTLEQLLDMKKRFPNALVAAHPECQPAVCQKSDFIGSTSQIFKYIKESPNKEFLMLTECGLGARLNMEYPDKKIVGTCTFCKYMKSNTLDDIIRVLKNPTPEDYITVSENVRIKAIKSIEAMFEYAEK